MTIRETLKSKMTGQQSAVNGSIVSQIKEKIPGQQSFETPIVSKIAEKIPAQQNASGPIRARLAEMKKNGNGNGNGNGPGADIPGGNGSEPNSTGGLFGDERKEQSPHPMGFYGRRQPFDTGLFGPDLG